MKGISKASARQGPSVAGTEARSIEALNRLITSPNLRMVSHLSQLSARITYPCHVSHSTTPYVTQFAVLGFISVEFMLAKGCGNALVLLHGIVNIR